MTSHRSLLGLGNNLLTHAEPNLLGMRLDALSAELEDEEVSALLRVAFEAGDADCLRQLLAPEVFEDWLERVVTESEAQRLQQELSRLLGAGARAFDDPERLCNLPPLPESFKELSAWAEEFDVVEVLREPVIRFVPNAKLTDVALTVAECALGEFDADLRSASLHQRTQLQESVRARLMALAKKGAALGARSSLWKSPPPSGPLRALTERLRAMLKGSSLHAIHALRFLPAHPVRIDLHSGIAHARLRSSEDEEGIPIRVDLFLSGYEHRNLRGQCSECKKPACIHRLALSARLLDACLSPEDRLHASVRELCEVPSWKRVLDELNDVRVEQARGSERVTFVLRDVEGVVHVGIYAQKAELETRKSLGKLVSAQQLLRRGGLSELDRTALEALIPHSRTLHAQFVKADISVLRALSDHPHVMREGEHHYLRISESSLRVTLIEQADGLLPEVSLDGEPVHTTPKPSQGYLIGESSSGERLVFAALDSKLRKLLTALFHFGGVFPEASFPTLAPWIKSLSHIAEVHAPSALDGFEEPTPRKLLLRIVPALDQGIDVCLGFRALPLGAIFQPGIGPELVHGLRDGKPVHARRDLKFERSAAARVVKALNLTDYMRIDPFRYRVEGHQEGLSLLSRVARLNDASLTVEWAEGAARVNIKGSARASDLKIDLFKKGQWFTLEGGIAHGEVSIGIGRLLEAARLGERFVEISRGSYLEMEQDLFERLTAAQFCAARLQGVSRLSQAALPFLLSKLGDSARGGDAASEDLIARLSHVSERIEEQDEDRALFDALGVTLRPYQRVGVSWLLKQTHWAPGACLADDMGLGKTLQASALLHARHELGPALVVAPTSLLDNWQTEITRCSTALRPLVYRGEQRSLPEGDFRPGDVLILSYETLLRDFAAFEGLHFATQVVDEAQVIKNARTMRAQAVSRVSADFRLALSGTPIENRLGDLWSLMQWIAPGLLGSWETFRARFATPIERYEDMERAGLLKSLVSPFFLRRTKREVEADLPERTEVICAVELSQAERDLYDAAVHEARRAIGHRSRHDSRRHVQILAELTRLRQLACHPKLVLHSDEATSSSKLERLLGMLRDILPRGHRALIFSQFTQHLALVREALERAGISSLYLDGATPGKARSGLVASFQAGTGQVFLISLKAGGTGLNLTEADYVFHLDPWWNPAAEDQASDRAHRLGQTRPVTIVKLVTQGTIEEKVLALHVHKRRLADAVLLGEASASTLDVETLSALLQA